MRWPAQVLHVVRKDLRLTARMLAVYLLVTAAATALATGMLAAAPPIPGSLLVVLFGMVVVAQAVQGDAPAAEGAYWATLPLHPLAVGASKLVFLGAVVLGVGLAGQLVALLAHDVATAHLPAMIGRSAVYGAMWLGVAAAFAALTRDLRGFAAALALTAVVFFLTSVTIVQWLGPERLPVGALPAWLGPTVLAGGAALLVVRQYRARDRRSGWGYAVLLAPAVLVVTGFGAAAAVQRAPAPGEVSPALRPAEASVVIHGPTHHASVSLILSGISPAHRYVVMRPRAVLHGPDGTRRRLDDSQPWATAYFGSDMAGPATDPADAGAVRGASVGVALPFRLAAAEVEAVRSGAARLEVTGHLEVRARRTLAELPLRPGARAVAGGTIATFLGVTDDPYGPAVVLRVSTVDPHGAGDGDFELFVQRASRYLLVNPARGDSVPLAMAHSMGGGPGLVLPGLGASDQRVQLRPVSGGDPASEVAPLRRLDAGWIRESHLRLLDWAAVGSVPFTAESRPE